MSRAWFNNATRWSSSSRTLAMLKEPVAVNAKVQGHRHMCSDLRPKVIDRRRLRPNWPAPMLQQAAADVGETRLGSWGAAAGSFSHNHPYPFGQPEKSSMPVSWATGARPGPGGRCRRRASTSSTGNFWQTRDRLLARTPSASPLDVGHVEADEGLCRAPHDFGTTKVSTRVYSFAGSWASTLSADSKRTSRRGRSLG